MEDFLLHWIDYIISIAVLAGSCFTGIILYLVSIRILKHLIKSTATKIDDIIIKHIKKPMKFVIPLFMINILLPFTRFPDNVLSFIRQLFSILFIISFSWILVKGFTIFQETVLHKMDINQKDNLHTRRVITQMQFIRKLVSVIIFIITLAVVLQNFSEIRQLGTTLLASAGIAGLIMGFAAQRSISTLFAGFQIAFTQPIRIDDVVIVENEWGWIEEITFTYVVVKIWDLRRLIVPITYFIEKPFQNWTRTSADILGTVFLYVDYSFPVAELRSRLEDFVKASGKWDGKVCNLQVTNTTEQTIELRALMSAENSPLLWDLRCEVREKLLDYLQTHHAGKLPRARVLLQQETEK